MPVECPGGGPAPPTLNLGGVALNPEMVWQDRNSWQPVAQSVARTLGGKQITYSQSLIKGRPITLVASNDRGWLDKDQVDLVQAIAEVPGSVYTFQYGAEVYQVQFRHQESPAFIAEAFVPRIEEQGTDYFTATIRLETI